ncbi:MAG: hypothetical protein QW096_11875 [Thermofilaceae archaeon]
MTSLFEFSIFLMLDELILTEYKTENVASKGSASVYGYFLIIIFTLICLVYDC